MPCVWHRFNFKQQKQVALGLCAGNDLCTGKAMGCRCSCPPSSALAHCAAAAACWACWCPAPSQPQSSELGASLGPGIPGEEGGAEGKERGLGGEERDTAGSRVRKRIQTNECGRQGTMRTVIAVVMVDARYSRAHTTGRLPDNWTEAEQRCIVAGAHVPRSFQYEDSRGMKLRTCSQPLPVADNCIQVSKAGMCVCCQKEQK